MNMKRLIRILFDILDKLFLLSRIILVLSVITLFVISWNQPETKIAVYIGGIMFTLLIYGVKWGEELYDWSNDRGV